MVKKKKIIRPRCKYCRTNRYVIPIIYGLHPNEELIAQEKAGTIILRGIARSVDAPNWCCQKCGYEFLR